MIAQRKIIHNSSKFAIDYEITKSLKKNILLSPYLKKDDVKDRRIENYYQNSESHSQKMNTIDLVKNIVIDCLSTRMKIQILKFI